MSEQNELQREATIQSPEPVEGGMSTSTSSADGGRERLQREIQGTRLADSGPNKVWPILKWGGLLLVIGGLLIAPNFVGRYTLFVLSLWAVTTIAAQGLNLTMGYAGKVSLAQAAFMGIGAYVSVQGSAFLRYE